MKKKMNKIQIPKDGIAGLKQNWKGDLLSGFLVFLIALPLCLGIALASGFPPIGGVLTAIIGGLFVGPLMGSRLSIKGPAAGLIAIAVAAVAELGEGNAMAGYKYALAVVVVTGLVQIVFALFKFGRFVDFFPASAVHGMLAAIGIIIIAKQFPVLMGVSPESSNPIALLLEIPSLINRSNPEIALIGGVSLLLLFGLPLINVSWVKKLPAPMLVVLIAIPIGSYFDLSHEHKYLFFNHDYSITPKFLVTLPGNFMDGITFPDFGKLFTFTSFKYIVMFALVGSLESLLTVKAVDGMDPFKRKSDTNRDLLAVGAGNTLAGFVGGLPMISEVVRSSANVGNEAKTRWSNFFHGGLLLIFVGFFPNLIHQIPLSALAAMLIFTGFRLASPQSFRKTLQIGKGQLAIFLTTIVVTLAEDLLVGLAAGILLKIILHVASGVSLKQLFNSGFEVEREEEQVIFKAKKAAVFTNYLGFKKQLEACPNDLNVVLDLSSVVLVDHTFMEQMDHLKHDYESRGGNFDVIGLEHLKPVSRHALAKRKAIKKKRFKK